MNTTSKKFPVFSFNHCISFIIFDFNQHAHIDQESLQMDTKRTENHHMTSRSSICPNNINVDEIVSKILKHI